MRSFDELLTEADAADVSGWGFGWLEGRATEERPPWGFAKLLAERLATVDSTLDLDTGGGEVLGEAEDFPQTMIATEGWPPNAERARAALGPRGVSIVDVAVGEPLPFPDSSFQLVSARHPVAPDWREIHRVLLPGGTYFAQHVGPASAFELIEEFLGPLVEERRGRDPERESAAARAAGLEIVNVRTADCRMEFFDVGAVVWTLRKCVWWVPNFSVDTYRETLARLDFQMRAGEPVVATSTRHLIEARRPAHA
jgi:SAM-dependent methyltransferase